MKTERNRQTCRTGRRITLAVVGLILLGGCNTLPLPPSTLPLVQALPPAEQGLLADAVQQAATKLPDGESGLLVINRNAEALRWRLALVDQARTSIDAQYYIWENDDTGTLLFSRLLDAAERGVRVRLLVDDLLLAVKDPEITAMTRHPNIDIKLFNPGRVRDSTLGYFGDVLLRLRELNRRMHNKLLVVDNRVAIVGGRNIGNPYFGLSEAYNFRDLDVLATGPVVVDISAAFDVYWNVNIAYPGHAMAPEATADDFIRLKTRVAEGLVADRPRLASYRESDAEQRRRILSLPERLVGGRADFLQDSPTDTNGDSPRLGKMLTTLAPPTHTELLIATPYLIPVDGFLDDLAATAHKGVRHTIITGSLGSNNHTITHSHYRKYRKAILATGADLYEFRHDPSAEILALTDVPPVAARFTSLHIKALVGDRRRCFIGSLNLDPRALRINTENGLYIESPALCGDLATQLDQLTLPENSWQVSRDENGFLQWQSGEKTLTHQPARSLWQRIADFFYGLLPIEDQL